MYILIVNDDGYKSPSLIKLAEKLAEKYKILVVAPHKCNSGMSHAASFNKPIYVKERHNFPYECYSITGTPADCVKIGLEISRGNYPDLIISGINTDYNIGTDVAYSGTSNAALEASLNNIPGLAVSTKVSNVNDYDYVVSYFVKNFEFYHSLSSSKYALNININSEEIGNKGNVIATLGKRVFCDIYLIDPYSSKGESYTLIGNPLPIENDVNSDVEWINKGYSTITPISFDRTFEEYIPILKQRLGL